MALPYDVLFLGSFAYAGYRTLGRWLKFNDDSAKHNTGADSVRERSSSGSHKTPYPSSPQPFPPHHQPIV
jgi:hypothetical protein